jgi:hypothetical protein
VVPAGEPGHIGGADHCAGDDRSDAEDLRERGARCPHRRRELLLGVAQLGIEAAQVLQERRGELAARGGNGTRRRELIEDTDGLACGDLLADPAAVADAR